MYKPKIGDRVRVRQVNTDPSEKFNIKYDGQIGYVTDIELTVTFVKYVYPYTVSFENKELTYAYFQVSELIPLDPIEDEEDLYV